MKSIRELLGKLNACCEAVEWAGNMPVEEVVANCHRGDWLLWLAQKIDIGLQPITLAKGHCAATVLHLMTDKRSQEAVRVAIAFGEGKATREELDASAYDSAAYYSAAYDSAYAAAEAAYAARKRNQGETADICRKYIGQLIVEKVNKTNK